MLIAYQAIIRNKGSKGNDERGAETLSAKRFEVLSGVEIVIFRQMIFSVRAPFQGIVDDLLTDGQLFCFTPLI
jgi:hypothetical protein